MRSWPCSACSPDPVDGANDVASEAIDSDLWATRRRRPTMPEPTEEWKESQALNWPVTSFRLAQLKSPFTTQDCAGLGGKGNRPKPRREDRMNERTNQLTRWLLNFGQEGAPKENRAESTQLDRTTSSFKLIDLLTALPLEKECLCVCVSLRLSVWVSVCVGAAHKRPVGAFFLMACVSMCVRVYIKESFRV